MTEFAPTLHTSVLNVALVLDTSLSMGHQRDNGTVAPVERLNAALPHFAESLRGITDHSVELCIIHFSDKVVVDRDFEDVQTITVPSISADGSGTDLGGGIGRALQELEDRREYLKSTGLEVRKGWLVVMTDGEPNRNSYPGYEAELAELVNKNGLWFCPVSVGAQEGYETLRSISPKQSPIQVSDSNADSVGWEEFFVFLSVSIATGTSLDDVMNDSDDEVGN